MKYMIAVVLAFFALIGVAQAAPTVSDVRNELITQLEHDGTLSTKAAAEARAHYVAPLVNQQTAVAEQAKAPADQSLWSKYASWTNLMKVVAVLFLLVAFHGVVVNIISGIWHLIAAVPVEVYQLVALGVTGTGTIAPHLLWASPHAFFLALFCAFASLMLLAWVAATHPELVKAILKLFNLGVPPGCILSFWLMLYFGALAFFYQSQIFGFFAVVAFSGMLSFGMTYRPGVLTLGFSPKMLPAVVIGHLLVLGLYVGGSLTGHLPPWNALFKSGIEYYCTIALGVAVLIAASPFEAVKERGVYIMLMMILFALSTVGFTILNFATISVIIMVFTALWALEWLMYVTFSANWILGCATTGGVLYLLSTMIQAYYAGHLQILTK